MIRFFSNKIPALIKPIENKTHNQVIQNNRIKWLERKVKFDTRRNAKDNHINIEDKV